MIWRTEGCILGIAVGKTFHARDIVVEKTLLYSEVDKQETLPIIQNR